MKSEHLSDAIAMECYGYRRLLELGLQQSWSIHQKFLLSVQLELTLEVAKPICPNREFTWVMPLLSHAELCRAVLSQEHRAIFAVPRKGVAVGRDRWP